MDETYSYAHNLFIDLCHGHYKTLHTVTLNSLKINKSGDFLQPTVKYIFVMETNVIWFFIIPSQFVLMCLVVKNLILIFVMAWCHSGAKPSSNPPSTYFAHEYVLLHAWSTIIWNFQSNSNSVEVMQWLYLWSSEWLDANYPHYRKVSNIRCTLVGNKFVDHSDTVGASPVGVAPTTSSFPT